MTRDLSSPTSTASAALVTQPGWLIEIKLDTFVRLSSRGTVSVMGNEWVGWDVKVSGLGLDPGRPSSGGSLALGDGDLTMTALILGFADPVIEISVWRYFAEAIADDDPVWVFHGIAGAISGGLGRAISVPLIARESSTLFSPRRRMTRETGFNALPAAGGIIVLNGEKYELQPER